MEAELFQNVKKDEIIMEVKEKRERFVRIAELRTNHILDGIRLLGNCSNKSNYDYSERDIKRIFGTIERELKKAKNKFFGVPEKQKRFKL